MVYEPLIWSEEFHESLHWERPGFSVAQGVEVASHLGCFLDLAVWVGVGQGVGERVGVAKMEAGVGVGVQSLGEFGLLALQFGLSVPFPPASVLSGAISVFLSCPGGIWV